MCGLNAIFSKCSRPVLREDIAEMNQLIAHRGSDDYGIESHDWYSLGFRRLSIIDTSKQGHQPMWDFSHRYLGVFNGELYNYIELKARLESVGIKFKSNSDAEVLINAYAYWGEDCLNRFQGMFSFIIVDVIGKSVFLARDPMGIKPLYHYEDSHYHYFSSEIKAFQAVSTLTADPGSYYEQYMFRFIAGEKTNFKRVFKVLPGNFWRYSNDTHRFSKHCYFDLKNTFYMSRKKVDLESIESSLNKSICLHTQSDVGYGLQLSGGLDSSYIAAILNREQHRKIDTYSVALSNSKYDESSYQIDVAKRYDTNHHMISLTGVDYFDHLEKATYYLDTPVVHGACVFLMLLYKEIARTNKVILTGEAADELFAGYDRHRPVRNHRLFSFMKLFKISPRYIPEYGKLRSLKYMLSNEWVHSVARYNLPEEYDQIFKLKSSNDFSYRKTALKFSSSDATNLTLYYDQLTYLTSLLDRQDKLSMSASVEARVPYCHADLFKLINPIPGKKKVHGMIGKYLLKCLAERHFSSDFVHRKKNGFLLPYAEWLRSVDRKHGYLTMLTDQTARERGIYHIESIKNMVECFNNGNDKFIKPLMTLIHLETWHRVFNL